ncbi:MAG: PaaI family thioesterase [Alphaproteobacteria bacterium]|nr:PaaI family thioesterase [Alphaproteobacteria bacterium]
MSFDPSAQGWKQRAAHGFSELVGPFWARREDEGWAYGFVAEPKHVNPRGVVHGGMLMTLVDQALSIIVWEAAQRRSCATIQLDTHFVAAVKPGDFVEARGKVVRQTRSLVFIHGALSVGGREVMTAMGVWKILGSE